MVALLHLLKIPLAADWDKDTVCVREREWENKFKVPSVTTVTTGPLRNCPTATHQPVINARPSAATANQVRTNTGIGMAPLISSASFTCSQSKGAALSEACSISKSAATLTRCQTHFTPTEAPNRSAWERIYCICLHLQPSITALYNSRLHLHLTALYSLRLQRLSSLSL